MKHSKRSSRSRQSSRSSRSTQTSPRPREWLGVLDHITAPDVPVVNVMGQDAFARLLVTAANRVVLSLRITSVRIPDFPYFSGLSTLFLERVIVHVIRVPTLKKLTCLHCHELTTVAGCPLIEDVEILGSPLVTLDIDYRLLTIRRVVVDHRELVKRNIIS